MDVETLKGKLAAERERLWQAVESLDPDERLRPGEDGWSARDILAHVAAAEQANVRFARLMAEQENPDQLQALAADYPDFVGPFSLDRFNAYTTDKSRNLSFEEAAALVRTVRGDTLAWLDSLAAEQLSRGGRHAVWGEQTLYSMVRILGLHDKMHTQDLLKRHRAGASEP